MASPKLSSSDKLIDDDLIVGNVDEIAGDDVKPKPSRRKNHKSCLIPIWFKTIDSYVANIMNIPKPLQKPKN